MDETPEELAQIRVEAAQIDVYKHRRRWRAVLAILIGAAGAGLVTMVFEGKRLARNPCERVRDELCRRDPKGLACQNYERILDDSVSDPTEDARSLLRGQCDKKIVRLKSEDGIEVP